MSTALENPKPIWQREEHFPEKPDVAPYGFLKEGTAHACANFTQLKQALSVDQELGKVHYIWTPDSPYFVLIEEEPELLEVLKPSRINQAESRFKSARQKLLIGGAIFAALTFSEYARFGSSIYKSNTMGLMAVLFLMFVLVPCYEAWKRLKTAKNLHNANLREEAAEIRFDLWTAKQPCIFTKGMLGMIIGITVLQVISPMFGTIQHGFDETVANAGLQKLLVQTDESWRIWTAPFLHGNAIHIFMNASGLWYIGRRVEILTKWPHLLLCYLISILVGSWCSFFFLAPNGISVGASGGLMGLLGFLLIFEILHPRLVPKPAKRRLIAGIVMTGFIGLVGYQFIDNAAHAGGLLAGIAYGYLGFKKSDTVRRPQLSTLDRIIGVSSMIILASAAIFTVVKMLQM